MKQKQLVDLLESAMPEIARTGDPEGVLLKTARTNNLSPAQLEKFGHVFNTMKTNYILKQASERGGSFSIVDVPKLVEKYATWKPTKKKAVIEKKAAFDFMKEEKYEELPSFNDWMRTNCDSTGHADYDKTGGVKFEDVSEGDEWTAIRYDDTPYDIMHKSASTHVDEKAMTAAHNVMAVSVENMKQAAYEARVELKEISDDLRRQFTPDNGEWAEAVEDVFHAYGREKAASVIGVIERNFLQEGFVFHPADLSKSAAMLAYRPFAMDRHNVFDKIDAALEYISMYKEASEFLEKEAKKDDDGPKLPDPDPSSSYRNRPLPPSDPDKNKRRKPLPNPDNGNNTPDPDDGPKSKGVATIGSSDETPGQDVTEEVYNSLLAGLKNPLKKKDRGASLLDVFNKEQNIIDKLRGAGPFEAYQGQKKIDDAVDTSARETTIQQLMLSDPIIANADLERVRALYDTIAEASPMFAKNPHLMGPALKEAIQYESVPVQQVKDLLGTQKTQLEIERLKAGLPTK